MEKELIDLLSFEDKTLIACNKSIFFRDNRELFDKMMLAIKAMEETGFNGIMPDNYKETMIEGASLMVKIINNDRFLKNLFDSKLKTNFKN